LILREAQYDYDLGEGDVGGKKFGSVFDGETHTRIKKQDLQGQTTDGTYPQSNL
jgi:hypothetical protein